jgi:hypothetical protein
MLIGVALARPVFSTGHRAFAMIVLADRSPAADSLAIRRTVAALEPRDTVIELRSFSSGLVAARRAAAVLGRTADSVQLVVVGSLVEGLWDAATPAIRALWPGRIEVVPLRAVTPAGPRLTLSGTSSGPAGAMVRLGRPADLLPEPGQTTALVRWPEADQVPLDTVFAVYAAGGALVAPLPRYALPDSGIPIAFYADGSPAVIERAVANGCERIAGFSMERGDAAIRSAGLRLMERLAAPCGHGWTADLFAPLDSGRRALLEGGGRLASGDELRDDGEVPPARWAVVLAGLVLLAERIVRQGRGRGKREEGRAEPPQPRIEGFL